MTDADLAAANESLANLSRAMGVSVDRFTQSMAAFTNALNEASNITPAQLAQNLSAIPSALIEHLRRNHPDAFDESGNLHDDWIHRISH